MEIEAGYLLDKDGLQVTATHLGPGTAVSRSRLFAPAPKGTDHSSKEYFFSLLDAGLERYTTESYLSLATGKLCRTVAIAFQHHLGQKLVLCIDTKVSA